MKDWIKKHILLLIIYLSCFAVFSQNKDTTDTDMWWDIDYTYPVIDTYPFSDTSPFIDTFPSFSVSIYSMFVYNVFDTLTEPCKKEEAIYIFEYRLEQIKKVIEKKPIRLMLNAIIENLELVTGIESESNISSYGKLYPTENDVKRWQKWLDENKNKLCWYKEGKALYTKENRDIKMLQERWRYDRLGCLKLRNESLSETLIDNFELENKPQYRFIEIFGRPNVETERDGDKILIYYFNSTCRDGKFIDSSDYCYAEFIFRFDKLTERNYIEGSVPSGAE